MAKVGTLTVDVTADTSGLTRGVDAGKQKLGEMNGAIDASIGKMKLMAAAAVAAGAALLVNMVKNSLEAVDALSKTARALDGTIDGLRALQIAAGYAGISNEQLTTILRQMSARLGEAETGTGTAAEALKRLGLDAQELGKLDLDARLAVFADRVKELGLSGQQTAYILRELGVRAGPEFIDFMRSGGDAIRAANREVIDLGLSVSKLEGEQIEAANDSMTRLGNISSGVAQRLALELAPAMEKIAEVVGPELIKFSQELTAELNRVAEAAKFVTTWLDRIRLLSDIHLGTDLFKPPAAQDGGGGPTGTGGGGGFGFDMGGDVDPADKRKAILEAEMEAEIEALARREEMRLEEDEREIMRYEERLERLTEFLDAGLLTEEQYLSFKEDLAADHAATLGAIDQKRHDDANKMLKRAGREEQRIKEQTANMEIKLKRQVADTAIGIITAMLGESKAARIAEVVMTKLAAAAEIFALFEIAKARAMAEYGWPAGLAVVGALTAQQAVSLGMLAASGVAEIAQILAQKGPSASFSGGGISGTISSSGERGGALGSASQVDPMPPRPTQITINLAPGRYHHEEVRDLIESLNEAISDGARLRVT